MSGSGACVVAGFAFALCVSPACKFPELPDLPADGGADAVVDARMCTPNAIECDDSSGIYTECSAQGVATVERHCPLGCATGVEKCLDVDPSNGLAPALDMAAAGADVFFAGTSTIDATTGAVTNDGVTTSVTSMLIGGIRVFVFRRLSVAGVLKITFGPPVALVVDGDVLITGTIDVSGDGSTPAAGALTSGACVGRSLSAFEVGSQGPGSGGGGRATRGGNGGAHGAGRDGSLGGDAQLDDDLIPLVGGCQGGDGQERLGGPILRALGGGGGGALQIVSRSKITLSNQGVIDASGGGGQSSMPDPSDATICGSGGGSGGGVLLEAPSVTMMGPQVSVSTKGGGGAAAGNGASAHHGADGGAGPGVAGGGINVGFAGGGVGGTESTSPSAGVAGSGAAGDGGGGGGAVGQLRVNTILGMFHRLDGATVRSTLTTGVVGARIER